MLSIYMDDSGTHAGAPIIGVGGLIGDEAQWEQFDVAWRARLNAPMPGKPRLNKFHAYDCQYCEGEFATYNRAESDLITREFRQIIIQSGVIGFARAIDKSAWDELVTDERRANMGGAEHFCVTGCIREILGDAWDHYKDEDVAIFYDKGRQTPDLDRIAEVDWGRGLDCPRIVSFTFVEVARFTPLQGADMIATESYWHGKRWLKDKSAPPRPHFEEFVKSTRGRGGLMTRAIIEQELNARNTDGTVKPEFYPPWMKAESS